MSSMSTTKKVNYMDIVDQAKTNYDSKEQLPWHDLKQWEGHINLLLVNFTFLVVGIFFHITLDKTDILKPYYIIKSLVLIVFLAKFFQTPDFVQQLWYMLSGGGATALFIFKDDTNKVLSLVLIIFFVVFSFTVYQKSASDKHRRLAIENNVHALAIQNKMNPRDAVAVCKYHMNEEGSFSMWYVCGSLKLPISTASVEMILAGGLFLFAVILILCACTGTDFFNSVIIEGLKGAGTLLSKGATALGESLLKNVPLMFSSLYQGASSLLGGIGSAFESAFGTAGRWFGSFFSTPPESIAATLNNTSLNVTGQ